jgi:predicted nucleic acid-binding protein
MAGNKFYVLDASFVARSILNSHSQASNYLEKLSLKKDVKFISSKLFNFELGNIIRYNLPSETTASNILDHVWKLNINFLDLTRPDILKTVSLSYELQQSFYDCSYLYLAILHNCQMLTCDKKFYQAAKHLGHIELWD